MEMEEDFEKRENYFRLLTPDLNNFPTGIESAAEPNRRLKDGLKLPLQLNSKFTTEFVNVFLQDIDPFYKNTFVVVNGRRKIHRFPISNSLCYFSPFNPVRNFAVKISSHYLFNWVVVAAMIFNWGFALWSGGVLSAPFEAVLLCFFTLEFGIKMIARGLLLDKFTYLRNYWHWLDLIIITTGFVFLGGLQDKYGVVGLGLRAVKLMGHITCLRTTVEAVMGVYKRFLNVLILITILLTTFAMIGIHANDGFLKNKCILDPNDYQKKNIDYETWNEDDENWLDNWDRQHHPICSNVTMTCPKGFTCKSGYGLTKYDGHFLYDNFLWGFLTSVRILKLDCWRSVDRAISRVGGNWSNVYFVSALLILSFYTTALFYGVVANAVGDLVKKKEDDAEVDKAYLNERKSQSLTGLDLIMQTLSRWFTEATPFCRMNSISVLNKFPKWVYSFLNGGMKCVIVINILFLTLIHDQMEQNERILTMMISYGRMVFSSVYTLEFTCKLCALGPVPYFKDNWNKLQFVIVLNAVVSFSLGYVHETTFLEALVILRLGQFWPSFRNLLRHIGKAFTQLFSYVVVINILIFIFSFANYKLFFGTSPKDYFEDSERKIYITGNLNNDRIAHRQILNHFRGKWVGLISRFTPDNTELDLKLVFSCLAVSTGSLFVLTFFILLCHQFEEKTESSQNNFNFLKRLKQKLFRGQPSEAISDQNDFSSNGFLNSNSVWVKVQRGCANVLRSKFFNTFVVVFILACSFPLKYNKPDKRGYRKRKMEKFGEEDEKHDMGPNTVLILFVFDVVFTLVMLLESLLRIGANGPFRFVKSNWTRLDLFILGATLLECILGEEKWNLGAVRALRPVLIFVL